MPILILAAGASSRMRGGDKLMEHVDGQPLLRLQAAKALAAGGPVYVAVPNLEHPRMSAIAGLDVIALPIPHASEGMSVTMRDAVAALPDAPAFMILLGDLVAIQVEDLQAVLAARDHNPDHLIWRGATADGHPGHPIIFDNSLKPEFAKLAGDSGGEVLVKPLQAQTHLVKFPDNRARFDLDTPEDWAAWRQQNG